MSSCRMAAISGSSSPATVVCAPCCGYRPETMPAAAPPAVILASKSPTRARLLHAAGVGFTPAEALVDEADMRLSLHAAGVPVEDAAVALAELKAAQVATWAPNDAIVIGADQLLEVEG